MKKSPLWAEERNEIDLSAQRAYEFCCARVSFKGAQQWRAHQLTPFTDHVKGVQRTAYALASFSQFFMSDIMHLTDLEEQWVKDLARFTALNKAVEHACREKGIRHIVMVSYPRKPCRMELCKERMNMVKHLRFRVPGVDGANVPATPSWIYTQQHLLMQRALDWFKDLKKWSNDLISPGEHYKSGFWASSPLLALACTKSYEVSTKVRLDTYLKDYSSGLMNYLRPFMIEGLPQPDFDGDADAFLHLFVEYSSRCIGNIQQKDDILYKLSNEDGVVYAYYDGVDHNDGDVHAVSAQRKKKAPPRPVEHPRELDPSKTVTRQTAAFIDEH
jgi:hypothetical protein